MRSLILMTVLGFGLLASGSPPPLPPLPQLHQPVAGRKTSVGTTRSSRPAVSAAASPTIIPLPQIWGIPPILNLTASNGRLNLRIDGTVGATVAVQSTTNLAAPFFWTTITNVTLTNIAPMETAASSAQPRDAIDLAYIPATQSTPLPTTTSTAKMQFFRGAMSEDYIILAGMVLPAKGYNARLIVVNMPGLKDDACYVSQTGSFIHYNQAIATPQLEGSGPTIRQIATTLANNLNLDWTTASEFTYSNGMGQILATVVATDPASSDPVAGKTPATSIVVDF